MRIMKIHNVKNIEYLFIVYNIRDLIIQNFNSETIDNIETDFVNKYVQDLDINRIRFLK